MGNPHCVVFRDDIDRINIEEVGPKFEFDPLFPERVNTEFVTVLDDHTIKMRVWERGSGETMACGTGATATLAAAASEGRADDCADVRLTGGTLRIEWDRGSNHLFMTGPAAIAFTGEWTDRI